MPVARTTLSAANATPPLATTIAHFCRRHDVECLRLKPVDANLLSVGQDAGVPQKKSLQIIAVNAARNKLLSQVRRRE